MSVYEKVVNRILLFRYHSKVSSLTANRLYPLSILWNKVLCVVFENMFNKKIENQIEIKIEENCKNLCNGTAFGLSNFLHLALHYKLSSQTQIISIENIGDRCMGIRSTCF